jgi:hypothetical protein
MIIDLSEKVASEGAKPMLDEPVPRYTLVDLGMVVAVPFLALLAAVPVAWGRACPGRMWRSRWPPTWCPASA